MDIQTATEQLRAKVGEDCGLGAVLKFDCGADGAIVIDATKVPNTLSNDAAVRGRLHRRAEPGHAGRPAVGRARADHRLHDGQVQGRRAT